MISALNIAGAPIIIIIINVINVINVIITAKPKRL